MNFPIRYNREITKFGSKCLVFYNKDMPDEFGYVFILDSKVIEVLYFTYSEYNDDYTLQNLACNFFEKFCYKNISYQLNMHIFLDNIECYRLAKIVNIRVIQNKFPKLTIKFDYDFIKIEFVSDTIKVYDLFLQSLYKHNHLFEEKSHFENCIFLTFKNVIEKIILIMQNEILLQNLEIISRFRQNNGKFSLYDVKSFGMYCFKNKILDYPSRESIEVFERQKILLSYISQFSDGKQNFINFKFIKIYKFMSKLIFEAFGVECEMSEYDTHIYDSRLQYLVNTVITHPEFDKYITTLEYKILK